MDDPPASRGRSTERRRAQFKRYKDDVKKRGEGRFYPYAMFHDTVDEPRRRVRHPSALAVIWEVDVVRRRTTNGTHQGMLGPEYTRAGPIPGTTSFVPRPDWYFYFPLLSPARLQVAEHGVSSARSASPDHPAHTADRACPSTTREWSGGSPRRPVAVVAAILVIVSMGGADVERGANRQGGRSPSEVINDRAGLGVKKNNLPAAAIPRREALRGSPGAPPAIRTSAAARRTSARRPTSPRSVRRTSGIQFQIDHLKCPSWRQSGLGPMPKFDSPRRGTAASASRIFLRSLQGSESSATCTIPGNARRPRDNWSHRPDDRREPACWPAERRAAHCSTGSAPVLRP